MNSFPTPIICLMGPTASGKTQIAVELVQALNLEIISVDSAMVYRGMNIGTAKPDAVTLEKAPHHLIDIRDPLDAYSAAQFCLDALHKIEQISASGKIPLLVGGTMLYFHTLFQGISAMPSADDATRQKIMAEAHAIGWIGLHDKLKRIDAKSAERIHPNDTQRIQRALEVFMLTGKTLTAHQATSSSPLMGAHLIKIALTPTVRSLLHERIAIRFHEMIEQGLIEEVRKLYLRGDLSLEIPAIRSVGYKQVWEYLEEKITFDEMIDKGIIATRQVAKRQLTWLRSMDNLQWFASENPDLFDEILTFIRHEL